MVPVKISRVSQDIFEYYQNYDCTNCVLTGDFIDMLIQRVSDQDKNYISYLLILILLTLTEVLLGMNMDK